MDNNNALLLRAEIVSDELMFSLTRAKMQGNEKILLTVENAHYFSDTLDLLRASFNESQRREIAAVADMKIIADIYREDYIGDGICGLCAFDADHGLDGHANECPGFGSNACFQWCGPREAGEDGR